MVLSKNIKIIAIGKSLIYLRDKGYIVKHRDIIFLDISELPHTSNQKIDVKCDYCEKEKKITYQKYIKNTKNLTLKYACSRICSQEKIENTCIGKYGVENPQQNYIVREKSKQTNLEKYGVENPFQSEEIKDKIKQTNLEKYGVENPFQSKEIKDKIKQTNLEKYGVEFSLQSEEVKDKSKKTILERYGVDTISKSKTIREKANKTNLEKYGYRYVLQSEDIKNKIKQNNLEKYGVEHPNKLEKYKNIIKKNNYTKAFIQYSNIFKNNDEYSFLNYEVNSVFILHKKCSINFTITPQNLYNRIKLKSCLCTHCYPISDQKSIKEKEISNWLKEYSEEFIEGDRSVLEGKELDIYIPLKNLAIEFNGLYWHSEKYTDKNYHLDKTLKCQEKTIQLLHIWEDEWAFKQDIVKSIILNRLGLIKEKIYARQCEIRIVEDSKLVRRFLEENHIQGYSQSSIKLGLYYKEELVSLMSFGYRHTNSKKEFELIRFCNKINLNVIGAASKLFKYFKSNYKFDELISYSDFRLFDGKMYGRLGFTKKHLSKPDYFWCKDLERKHRFNFNKQKLIKEGFDGSKTEVEIMHERGFFRVFGCGQYRWELKD